MYKVLNYSANLQSISILNCSPFPPVVSEAKDVIKLAMQLRSVMRNPLT